MLRSEKGLLYKIHYRTSEMATRYTVGRGRQGIEHYYPFGLCW